MKDLKPVYKATTEEADILALGKLEEKRVIKHLYPISSCMQDFCGGKITVKISRAN